MPSVLPLERLIAELSQSPLIISNALSSLGKRAEVSSVEGEWSPRQNVEHLTALQHIWLGLMTRAHETGSVPSREAHWMQIVEELRLNQVPEYQLIEHFSSDRARLITFLGTLNESELNHQYEFRLKNGKPTSRSIDGITQRLLRHEQQHIRELHRASDAQ